MNSLNFRNRNRKKIRINVAIIAFACMFSLLFSSFAYGTTEVTDSDDIALNYTTQHTTTPVMNEASEQESDFLPEDNDELVTTGTKKQTITTDKTNYDGIVGEKTVVKAKAKGSITFSSSDKSVAKINKTSGQIAMIASGYVTITIKASGTDTYASATKEIRVTVYPKQLNPVNLEIKTNGKTRVQLTWNKVAFADSYKLLKYNVATGKYMKVSSFDNTILETTITRNAGRYAIRAFATVHDTKIRSSSLKSVTVTSLAVKADTYKQSKIIHKYTTSNLNELCEITGADGTRVPQSFCFTGDQYVVSYVNTEGTKGHLLSYSRKGKLKKTGPLVKMGHANGSTFNTNTGEIYTVRTHSEVKSKICTVLSPDTLKVTRKFNLSKYASGIAYDESNDKYYVSKGNEVYIYNSKFRYEKTIPKFIRYNHAQDIGAYNGVVLVCTWVSDKTSYVDLYRVSDGAYLGSYSFCFDEIESVIVDDGYLVILMNTVGTYHDHIFKTNERITLE